MSGQPLLSPAGPGGSWPPLMVGHGSLMFAASAVGSMVAHWLPKSLLKNEMGKTGVQDTDSKRRGGKSTSPVSTGQSPRT